MTHTKTSDPPARRRSMGRRIPNLIFQYDSEKGSEFRVQCEVPFDDEEDAAQVKKDVMTGTPETLKRAKKRILELVDPDATEIFRQIVGQAFDDNIKGIQGERTRR